jgi:hypothetical protein
MKQTAPAVCVLPLGPSAPVSCFNNRGVVLGGPHLAAGRFGRARGAYLAAAYAGAALSLRDFLPQLRNFSRYT